MGAEYWAGLATGLGWGVTAGLVVALLVALGLKRLPLLPTEPQSGAETTRVGFPSFGERRA